MEKLYYDDAQFRPCPRTGRILQGSVDGRNSKDLSIDQPLPCNGSARGQQGLALFDSHIGLQDLILFNYEPQGLMLGNLEPV